MGRKTSTHNLGVLVTAAIPPTIFYAAKNPSQHEGNTNHLIHKLNYLALLIKCKFHYSLAGLTAKQHAWEGEVSSSLRGLEHLT